MSTLLPEVCILLHPQAEMDIKMHNVWLHVRQYACVIWSELLVQDTKYLFAIYMI